MRSNQAYLALLSLGVGFLMGSLFSVTVMRLRGEQHSTSDWSKQERELKELREQKEEAEDKVQRTIDMLKQNRMLADQDLGPIQAAPPPRRIPEPEPPRDPITPPSDTERRPSSDNPPVRQKEPPSVPGNTPSPKGVPQSDSKKSSTL